MSDSTLTEEEEQPSGNDSGDVGNLTKIVGTIWNFGLLTDASDELEEVDWFLISVTTFYIGVVGLVVWSLITFTIFLIEYLMSSPGIVGGVSRVVQAGPWIPVVLFIFSLVSRWAVKRLQESTAPGQTAEFNGELSVFLISVISLFTAGVFRWGIHSTVSTLYGSELGVQAVITTMFIDGVYVSLLIIGIGGSSSIVFKEKDN